MQFWFFSDLILIEIEKVCALPVSHLISPGCALPTNRLSLRLPQWASPSASPPWPSLLPSSSPSPPSPSSSLSSPPPQLISPCCALPAHRQSLHLPQWATYCLTQYCPCYINCQSSWNWHFLLYLLCHFLPTPCHYSIVIVRVFWPSARSKKGFEKARVANCSHTSYW